MSLLLLLPLLGTLLCLLLAWRSWPRAEDDLQQAALLPFADEHEGHAQRRPVPPDEVFDVFEA